MTCVDFVDVTSYQTELNTNIMIYVTIYDKVHNYDFVHFTTVPNYVDFDYISHWSPYKL